MESKRKRPTQRSGWAWKIDVGWGWKIDVGGLGRLSVKAHGLRSMGLLFLKDRDNADPPSAVGGLEGI